MPYISRSQLRNYGIVVLIVALTLVLMLLLDPWLGMSKTPFLLFFSAVMLSAWHGGLKSGLLATFLSTLLSSYFFLPPEYSLKFASSDFMRMGLFAGEGILFSILCEALKSTKRRAEVNLYKLKANEEKFRVALSSSDVVVFQQDQNLRYQWIHNPQNLDTAKEMLGKSDYQLFPASTAEQLTAIKRRVLETGISAREEVCLTVRGEVRYYDLLVEPLINENSVSGITCVALNVTERKQAELENIQLHQELRQAIQQKDESLALLNAWLMSSPVALAFFNTELCYVYANEALASINGIPQHQHIGRSLQQVLPEWATQLEPLLRQVMQTKKPLLNQEVSGETYQSRVYRHGLVSYYPVCLPDGQLLGVGVTGIDITQLKQTEQALRESEAKFRSVVDSNMIGIGFWQENGKVTDANDALLKMIGYTREELVARKLNWQALTPTEYLPLDEQALAQLENNSFCTPYEKEYICKDGSRIAILVGASHFQGTVDRGAFFVIDITERKQAENTRRYIAQTSNILATSLDYEETLEQIAKISVPQLADWCLVEILNEDGSIRRLPIAHADPSKSEWALQLQRYAPVTKDVNPIARVLRTGQAELISQINDSFLIAVTENDEHLQAVRQMGCKSFMVVPLVAHQRILGSISFVSSKSNRPYQERDLALAKDIAYRAALAVENARLYQDSHQALVHYAESLSLLDALLAGAPVAVCFLDRELRYLRINQVLADINDLSIEEHLGRKLREVLPEMADEFEPQLQLVLDTGEPMLNVDIRGQTTEEPTRQGYWLGNYYPVYNTLGETIGIGIILADVTAAKQTEIALRESEARFRAMFDQAAVGITLVRLDGQFLQINPAFCEITGYSREELIQMNFQEITHPDDLEVDWDYARRVLAKEINGYSLKKRYIRKDGSVIWVNLTSSAVWDDDGQPKYAMGIVEDISKQQAALHERKKAEETQYFLVEASALLASSLDYHVTLTGVANLAVPTLADWCIVDIFQADLSSQQIALATANPAKRFNLQELRQRYPSPNGEQHPLMQQVRQGQSVFYPEFPDTILAEIAQDQTHLQLLQNLGIQSVMMIPLRSRGQVFGAISFVMADSGRHYEQANLGLAEDIARRAATAIDNARLYQETQQARQTAEKAVSRTLLLQKITAALSQALTPQQVADVVMHQGVAALGAKAGSVLLLTDQGTALKIVQAIGYPQSDIDTVETFPLTASIPSAEVVRTGQPIFIDNRADWLARYPHLARIPTTNGDFAYACVPLVQEGKAIGTLGLNFAIAQTFNQEYQGFMLTLGQQCAQAIARAQLYEAEQTAREEAETANRIKDEFLAVLSHELRTPLNPILGWAKLLRTRQFDEATKVRALETIERNAKLQTQLIEDLLDVSRILQGKLKLNVSTMDLRTTITAALETVRLAAEAKSIEIQTTFSTDILQVMGDSDRLQQVIWNLLSNAVKFTPSGGRVEVHLEQIGANAQIQVIDTGKGISPEFLPYVFDYFRQADSKTTRVFGGLGLGLAIVRRLVELHGGTIHADSPGEGQGATFAVRLPLLKTSPLPKANFKSSPLEITTEESLLSGVKILLVDDQADVREFFTFALEQYGATVTAVASANEALTALSQSKPDILLSDIGMPLMDGYMLLREVRKRSPEQGGQIPAIALSAYAGEFNQKQALAAGFQKHVSKPAEPIELATVIVNLIKRQ
ncbi:PAS domain S-box protein [Halotia branconii]|uniref:Circadian input-output histidine kinase CikA n=1 Tax=Halotia branconii CENA392 TaxID=1539056 RepID=A0AAJ6NML1_9CYAN|nr:PAS domain S-box protein [Halotia branconii]WGV23197.1 PAS domain S-box protein [Halotia branconii CENA392]